MSNPKLTVLFEKMRGKTFELDKDVVTAGRKSEMDICIKDGTMSSHHCDFIHSPDGSYIIRDNDSTNGTRVNNIQIKEQKLKNSDIIQLGGVEFLYDTPNPAGTDSFTTSRSHTIDLSSIDTNLSAVREVSNFSPFAVEEQKKAQMAKKAFAIGLAVFAVIVFILLIWVVIVVNMQ